jgi:hypothetical protein
MRITEKDLKEGEVICNKCEGGGSWPQLFLEEEDARFYRCPKCYGEGKLDWIYAVTGKPPEPFWFQIPRIRNVYPKLIASEIISVQPIQSSASKGVFKWRRAGMFWRVSKLWRQLLIILSKGKEEDGTTISLEKKSQLF